MGGILMASLGQWLISPSAIHHDLLRHGTRLGTIVWWALLISVWLLLWWLF